MLQVELSASKRQESGKGAMRRLRMSGQTPAIVYGGGAENISLALETQPLFQKLLEIYRTNAIITLKIDDGTEKSVILKEVQTDPVRDTLVHADFLEIDLTLDRQFAVPVSFTGNAVGVDLGGVLNVVNETVLLEGKPINIPDGVSIDISELNIGDSINIGTLEIPEGLKLITDSNATCVMVSKPGGTEEEEGIGEEEEGVEEGAEGASAEPAGEPQE